MSILSQGFFVLRRPRLPLNVLYDFHARVGNDRELFETELIRLFSQPAMLEAIYLASPELCDAFTGLLEGRVKTGVDKLLLTLYKYLVRMTSRSTPFGTFAGCAVGTIGSQTQIAFDPAAPEESHARLDMNCVAEIADALVQHPAIRKGLRFYPNTSMYRIGDQYRYVESSMEEHRRAYTLTSVAASPYLERILEKAGRGATIRELVQCTVSDEITAREASRYVEQVIEAQILVSELSPTVTGKVFFETIPARLEGVKGAAEELAQLGQIGHLLGSAEPGVGRFEAIKSAVRAHFPSVGSKDLVQSDLFYPTRSCMLGERAANVLVKEFQKIEFLGETHPVPDMDDFRKRFLDRYEQQEMPLLEVLDGETGIGYGSQLSADHLPLLDGLPFPETPKRNVREMSPLAAFREKVFLRALAEGAQTVALTDAMLDELRKPESSEAGKRGGAAPAGTPGARTPGARTPGDRTPAARTPENRTPGAGTPEAGMPGARMPAARTPEARTPDSFYLFGQLVTASAKAVDAGDFKFALNAMGGPSGLKLIGRFCHGNPSLSEWVAKAVKEEESCEPDVIFAEIAHLPEARVGNVLMRPHFRDYEIPYLAGSSMPEANQILPEDLMVSVSPSGEVILRSKRLNKRVLPRLTNAHNFTGGLPVYRFLCELTYQDNYRYLAWNWEHLAASVFLPRIEYKHWILSRATWNIAAEMLTGPTALNLAAWRALRDTYRIPRYVQLRQGDNEFLIDGESEFSMQVLAEAMRKHGRITLAEFLESGATGLLSGEGAHYAHEVLIPFLHREVPAPAVAALPSGPARQAWNAVPPPAAVIAPKRSFMAGSEWLYVKIYAGTKTADRLLTAVIKPLADRLVAANVIEKWFFVRYEDPRHHIRLRFYHGSNPSFWHRVLTELNLLLYPMLAEGTVHKVQTDTYKRELERYGAYAYAEVESIFFADSQATAGFLDMISGDEGEHYRWLIGIRGVDMLLSDFNFTAEEKYALVRHLQEGFSREFRADSRLTVQLNNRYRTHSGEVQRFLDPRQDAGNHITGAIRLFRERSARIRKSMKALVPGLRVSLFSFAASLTHMFVNRLFVSRQREHEMVIYHYLGKYYDSRLAKAKKLPLTTFPGHVTQ